MEKSGCSCATPSDQYNGWECSITNGECLFFWPSAKMCAKIYGEGPDAVEENKEEKTE